MAANLEKISKLGLILSFFVAVLLGIGSLLCLGSGRSGRLGEEATFSALDTARWFLSGRLCLP